MTNYLIIQGPIISKGPTGEGWIDKNIPFSSDSPENIEFNCIKNLNRMIEEGSKASYKIIISVGGQKIDLKPLNVKGNCSAIFNSDDEIERRVGNDYLINPQRFRQFFSILTALEKIKGNPNDIVIKIRADMYFSRKLLEVMFAQIAGNKQNFFVPYVLHSRLITVQDFYFGAKYDNFLKLCKLICFGKDSNIERSVHYSISTFLYFNQNGKNIDSKLDTFFDPEDINKPRPFFARSKLLLNILNFNLKTFKTFPQQVWDNANLRGKLFKSKNKKSNKYFKKSQVFQKNIDEGIKIVYLLCLLDLLLFGRQLHQPNQRLKFYFSKLGLIVFRSVIYERLKAFCNFYFRKNKN